MSEMRWNNKGVNISVVVGSELIMHSFMSVLLIFTHWFLHALTLVLLPLSLPSHFYYYKRLIMKLLVLSPSKPVHRLAVLHTWMEQHAVFSVYQDWTAWVATTYVSYMARFMQSTHICSHVREIETQQDAPFCSFTPLVKAHLTGNPCSVCVCVRNTRRKCIAV